MDGLPPDEVWWVEDEAAVDADSTTGARLKVPREFHDAARFAACHHAADRWSLMYRMLWRLTHGEPHLMSLGGDEQVARLHRYDQSVHRDLHKMKAFVRFKKTADEAGERFVAWFEPEHFIIRLATDFFVRRFTNMRWSILTPVGCAHWEGGGKPLITAGLSSAVPHHDELNDLWQTYYRHIFNPARVKTEAMRAEMPQKYWKHLPEAAEISDLLIRADSRVDSMIQAEMRPASLQCGERPASYTHVLQAQMTESGESLERIAASVRACTSCDLCYSATQAVPGEGAANASVMLIGEQPGDQEDLIGRPFVGPAGQLLMGVLDDLGVERESLYLTNAVKHFKFKVTPKRRLHERPREGEIQACRSWLMNEIDLVKPLMIVCLGVTAASSLFGRTVRLKDVQGQIFQSGGSQLMVTLHPSAVLRSSRPETAREQLKRDLQQAFTLV